METAAGGMSGPMSLRFPTDGSQRKAGSGGGSRRRRRDTAARPAESPLRQDLALSGSRWSRRAAAPARSVDVAAALLVVDVAGTDPASAVEDVIAIGAVLVTGRKVDQCAVEDLVAAGGRAGMGGRSAGGFGSCCGSVRARCSTPRGRREAHEEGEFRECQAEPLPNEPGAAGCGTGGRGPPAGRVRDHGASERRSRRSMCRAAGLFRRLAGWSPSPPARRSVVATR